MRVEGLQTSRVTVDVDPVQIVEQVAAAIKRSAGLPSGSYLHGDQIKFTEEHHTSHSWETVRIAVEKPTQEQIDLLKAIDLFVKKTKQKPWA